MSFASDTNDDASSQVALAFESFSETIVRCMEDEWLLLDPIDNASLNSSGTVERPDQYRFTVHCLSKEKKLEECYYAINDIKRAAFGLYPEAEFNDNNALLTYKNDEREFKLLDELPDPTAKRNHRHLYIKFVSSHTVRKKSELNRDFFFEFRSIQVVSSVRIHSAS